MQASGHSSRDSIQVRLHLLQCPLAMRWAQTCHSQISCTWQGGISLCLHWGSTLLPEWWHMEGLPSRGAGATRLRSPTSRREELCFRGRGKGHAQSQNTNTPGSPNTGFPLDRACSQFSQSRDSGPVSAHCCLVTQLNCIRSLGKQKINLPFLKNLISPRRRKGLINPLFTFHVAKSIGYPSYSAGENVKCCGRHGKVGWLLSKSPGELPYDPASPLSLSYAQKK